MFGAIIIGDQWEFVLVIVIGMKINVRYIKPTRRRRLMGKTFRKEKVIKVSDVKARDDLNDMRRGRAFADKTKYTRKTKHKGRTDGA